MTDPARGSAGGYPSDESVSPDPPPADVPGLARGGGVAPGDTPPASDSESALTGSRDGTPNQSAPSASRTPRVVALSLIGLLVLALLGFIIAMIYMAAT